jgi:hypothetical protein
MHFNLSLLLEFFRRSITQCGVQTQPIVILLDELFDVHQQMIQVIVLVGVDYIFGGVGPVVSKRPTSCRRTGSLLRRERGTAVRIMGFSGGRKSFQCKAKPL